jgi:hypothetical protein
LHAIIQQAQQCGFPHEFLEEARTVRRQLLQLATPLPPAAADSNTADSAVAAACSDALRLLLLLRATPSMDESALRCALQDLVNSLDVDAVLAALPPVATSTATDTTAADSENGAAGAADDSTMSDSSVTGQHDAGADTAAAAGNAAAAADKHDGRVEYIDDMATDDTVQATTAAAAAEATDAITGEHEQ